MARIPDSNELKETMWQPITDDRRVLHQEQIAAAVAEAQAAPARPMKMRRRFSVIAVTAALLALPAGVAFAAEDSLPGDVLYPVKRVTETVRSWLDSDIVAQHRVEELEGLLAVDASPDRIADQIVRASDEVDRLSPGHQLRDRFSAAHSDVRDDHTGGGFVDAATTTTVPGDRPTTTVEVDTTVPDTTTTVPDGTTTTTPTDRTTTTVVDVTTTTVGDRKTTRVFGRVLAGPTCPVERFPPDPDCADQPVAGALLVVARPGGEEVRLVESDAEGRFALRLEPGVYVLQPQPYDGLLGNAPPQEFVVELEPVELMVGYDTGIR